MSAVDVTRSVLKRRLRLKTLLVFLALLLKLKVSAYRCLVASVLVPHRR